MRYLGCHNDKLIFYLPVILNAISVIKRSVYIALQFCQSRGSQQFHLWYETHGNDAASVYLKIYAV